MMLERRKQLVLILLFMTLADVCRAMNVCTPNPCENEGVCTVISSNVYDCQCMYGYSGTNCEQDIDFCTSEPCLNQGNCTDGIFSFSCECLVGFTGRQCEVDIDECEGEPCGDYGQCIDDQGEYNCMCDTGYTGNNCDIDIDDCSPSPCINGNCTDLVDGYTCNCFPSFAGPDCSLTTNCSVDENVCQNNGVCNVTVAGLERLVSCNCITGFTGAQCEIDIDECAGDPCNNGGTCIDLINQYSCVCPMEYTGDVCSEDLCDSLDCENNAICRMGQCFCRNGYTGILCEINIDDCSSSPCSNGGSCIDQVAGYICQCPGEFTGDFCNISTSDACSSAPCANGGTCISIGTSDYSCTCPSGFTGINCSEEINFCLSASCQPNTTAICISRPEGFECICQLGYEGEWCDTDIDVCDQLEPCANGGLCLEREGLGYSCQCTSGYEGVNCSIEIDECTSNPCDNQATCQDELAGYRCICPVGFTGSECELNINDCLSFPCANGGTCEDEVDDYVCLCPLGFTGIDCSISVVSCNDEPCANDGTCTENDFGFICECAPGFTGDNCIMNIDDCTSSPCHGDAVCVDGIDSFSCICPTGFTGLDCSEVIDHCSSNPCLNEGTCISLLEGYTCNCPEGYTGIECETELCTLSCQNGGECINNDGGTPTCSCSPGFTGSLCETPFHSCDTLPCGNNSTCLPLTNNTYICLCSPGFTGGSCEEEVNECMDDPCGDNGVCLDLVNGFECMCSNGLTGERCEININDCSPNPCRYNSTCIDLTANYSCECAPGFEGRNCSIDLDLCDPQPCMNGGSCSQNLSQGSVNCSCPSGYNGTYCQFDIDECNTTVPLCLNRGECVNTPGSFQCLCHAGFSGSLCENYNDCVGISLCMNNATCIDTGFDFMCMCPPGYTGVLCDIEINECDSDPCLNGGVCQDHFLDFSCVCTQHYTGPLCDINLNPCSSTPCMNGADCRNGEPESEQFSCDCAPGYTGVLCGEDIDDCTSNPCPLGSTCVDAINNFTCICPPGFTGQLCDNNYIDDCAFPFCLNGGTCEDIGSDYICICDTGFNGPNCEYGTNECLDDPCFNNGICRDLFGGFECMCMPGFSGIECEIDINECMGIDCNNGTCLDGVNEYLCLCLPGYTGERCETDFNDCEEVECQFGGTCIDLVNNYTCQCTTGYEGRHCELNINDCLGIDCGNGSCIDQVADYYCQCDMGYTGSACETMIDDCEQQPCMNAGSCIDQLNNFTCVCPDGFTGRFCQINIDDCSNITCSNGGSCVDGINRFTCECVFGYGGDFCDTILDLCTSETCYNNATCNTISPGVTQCTCTPLYTGSACEIYINLCNDEPCNNDGECIPTETDGEPGFVCNCPTPYRGTRCEVFDPCAGQPCFNNGSCLVDIDTESGYQCDCVSPFLGSNCFFSDLCLLNSPCTNGATCINNLPSLNESTPVEETTTSCLCLPDFTGDLCEVEITPCYHQPCMNGGTCLVDSDIELGYVCQCQLYWSGVNCSTEINIVTSSFSGSSFISHSIPPTSQSGFNYSLALLTTRPAGLVLYITGFDSSETTHIALGLENGGLVLYITTDSESVQLRPLVEVIDGNWHVVELHVDTSQASLRVDSVLESTVLTGVIPEIDGVVFVGGLPDFSLLTDSGISQSIGIVGCVHDRSANGQSVELSATPHDGRGISQCSQPVCGYIQCQNEAECSEITEPPGFTCSCLPFFSGQFCEIALPVCDPNPCLFGGSCREEFATFSCLCPLGRGGRTCEEDISIDVPSFSGSSYIAYPTNSLFSSFLQTLTISLTFNSLTTNGLLFFTSTSETDFTDYFSLALVNGHVEMRYNLGSGNFSVISNTNLTLGSWHTLTATLSSGRGEITIDDELTIVGATQSLFTILNTENDIWLGGYMNYLDLSSITGTVSGFTGCISDLSVDGSTVGLILQADYGYGVTQCETSSCDNQPCLNGGTCVEEGPSFVCVCPVGLSGPLCSGETDVCNSDPDLCAEGATCVNSQDGLSFYCLCPIGRDGERCDEVIDLDTPLFNTTSYIQYNPYSFDPPLSTLTLSFKPASANGVLFYYGDYTQNTDFFSVSIIQQRVEYRFFLGSATVILIGDQVDLNSWHYVEVSLNGPRGTLRVDGGEEISHEPQGSSTVLNAAGDMFVGGVSDYGTVSPSAGTEVGLTGCISDIEINGISVDLLGSAVDGRSVAECPVDRCASITCSNGGVCHIRGGYQPQCLCPLGFTGPSCDSVVDIIVPYFNGESSYLVHDSLTNVFAMTSLTLEIRPATPTGLLLFNKQANGIDYIAVLLRDGVVEFWYNLGSGPATISSRDPLVLNEWHTIEVYRSGSSGQLIVDDNLPVTGSSQGSLTGLQLGDPLYIGGVSDSVSGDLPSLIRGVGEFGGCIRNIDVNGNTLSLVSDAGQGFGIDECPNLPCTNNPCLNNGVCFVQSGNGSSGQQCDCSLPFTGEICSQRVEDFTDVEFSGQGYLEFSAEAVGISQQRISTVIEISFTPTLLTGLLLYMGPIDSTSNLDYLYIALSDGLPELRFDLGSGEVFAVTQETVREGVNNTITVSRTGGDGLLAVNGGDSVSSLSESEATNFDSFENSFIAYLGGAPSVSSLTNGRFTTGITGCLTTLKIGRIGSLQDIPLTMATTGQAARTCS